MSRVGVADDDIFGEGGDFDLQSVNLVKGKLADIMLPASINKVNQMRGKLHDINTEKSKVCLEYLDSCGKARMIDLMTICHILNREQLYILEDEEDNVSTDDFLRSLEDHISRDIGSVSLQD